MTEFIMAAPGTRSISGDDKIFGIAKAANDMAHEVGADKVTNATIGALLDDQGELMVMPSIINTLKNLSDIEIAAYAPIAGVPEFLRSVVPAVFGKYKPEGFIEAFATPGGTGAIRNTIQNYTNVGDKVLTSDWYWSPYKTIADENGRKIETYKMFSEEGTLNVHAIEEKVNELLAEQGRVVLLFNAPAHNPTGYSPTSQEWDSLLAALKRSAANKENKIILFVDAAYIDFAGDPEESRSFMPKLSNLPENLLPIVAFSMSKGYTLYGMRGGAMICVTPNEAIANEFKVVNMYSGRGTWSNGTRSAMMILSKIYHNKDLEDKVAKERAEFRELLDRRASAFISSADEVGLHHCPFHAGFFITVPCDNADEICKRMQGEGLFVVPIGAGIRIAISAVSEEKCAEMPGIMARYIAEVNG